MSIQNNLDIIVASQIKPDVQSGLNVAASKSESSYDFEKMLAAAKNESNKTETVEEKPAENKAEKTVEEKADSKKTEFQNKAEEQSDKKIQEKEYVKPEPGLAVKNLKSESKVVVRGEKTTLQKDVKEQKTVNLKDFKKADSKKAEVKNSFIDYEKISLIGQKTAEKSIEIKDFNSQKKSELAVKTEKFEKEINFDKNSFKEVQVENNDTELFASETVNFKDLLASNQKESEGETDFNESEMAGKEVKVSKLDKDGKITVQDERTKVPADETKEIKTEVKIENDKTATITMNMAQEVQSNVISADTQSAAGNNSNYQSMFANQLAQSAPDFVQAGKIILKDNNQGTINLVIHPDDLGNVKIHLTLDGKSVSAQITVATKEAMEIFKDNAETLREAFIKQGFENATFDVSYGNNSGLGQNSDFSEQNDGRELYAKRAYSDVFMSEEADYSDFENISNPGNYSVNIVA